MTQCLSKFGSHILLLLCVLIIATGCGRRGALEAPVTATVIEADENGEVQPEEVKEDKPFFLDGLL